MYVKLRKVGNSLAATIPNEIVVQLDLRGGDPCWVTEKNGTIAFRPEKGKLRGAALMEEYYGKQIDKIGQIETEVVDTGDPRGSEVW